MVQTGQCMVVTQPEELIFDQFRRRLLRMDMDSRTFTEGQSQAAFFYLRGHKNRGRLCKRIFIILLEDVEVWVVVTTIGIRVGQAGAMAAGEHPNGKRAMGAAITAGKKATSRGSANCDSWNVTIVVREVTKRVIVREANSLQTFCRTLSLKVAEWPKGWISFLW